MSRNFAVISLFVLAAAMSIPKTVLAADADKGKALYGTLCASCHGDTGAGDGPVALSLPPEMKPKNLQAGGFKFATDDAKFKELLQKGGAAVGLNPLMPGAPGSSDVDLDNIIAFVHSLKK